MNEKSGRRSGVSKLLAGTAPVTEDGVINPTDAATAPIGADAPVPPSDVVPVPAAGGELPEPAAVLPDPTLTAEPGLVPPLVTASPPLAAEPSALDVVQADAAADRIAAGLEEPADRDRVHAAVAGQPTLAIDTGRHAVDAGALADTLFGDGDDLMGDRGVGVGREPSVDQIMEALELLALRDPIGMDLIRTRFFGEGDAGASRVVSPAPTVTVIEVVGPPQGRRRAGMTFGAEPRRFAANALRADELDAIRSDPQLAVGVSEVDADVFGSPA